MPFHAARPHAATLLVMLSVVSGVCRAQAADESPCVGPNCAQQLTAALTETVDYFRQGNTAAAAERAALLRTRFPASAQVVRSLTDTATQLEENGQIASAVGAYAAAVAMGADDLTTEAALIGWARTCLTQGYVTQSRDAILRLRQQFPDSSFIAQAGVLQARIDKSETSEPQRLAALEEQATQAYKEALQVGRENHLDQSIQLLDNVITAYPNTPAALRAADAKGHTLLKTGRRAEASAVFQSILATCEKATPHARIVQTARMRLAANYHLARDRARALALYRQVAAEDCSLASGAAVKAAGLSFELLQMKVQATQPAGGEGWEGLREQIREAVGRPRATANERARAQLMEIESFCWEHNYSAAADAARLYFQTYEGPAFRRDLATVAFFAGEALQKLNRHAEALEYFRWITSTYAKDNSVWRGGDHLSRTYYDIWLSLRKLHAPPEEIAAAAKALQDRFPNSGYARAVQPARQQEETKDAR